MDDFIIALKKSGFKGDVDDSIEQRDLYSHDASMFEIRPQLVVAPKDSADVEKLVSLVAKNKPQMPHLWLIFCDERD